MFWRATIPYAVFAVLLAGPLSSAAPELASCGTALDRGDYASAARDAQAYIRLHPTSASAHVMLARAQMGLNNAPAALNELRQALRREPDNLDALYYLSKLSDVLARTQFVALAKMAPDSARTHQLQAEGFAAQGKPDEAEQEYLTALERRPGTPAIMNAIGDLKREDKSVKCDQALEWYGKVLQKDPANFDALYGSGACYLRMQEIELAATSFRSALKSNPSSIDARLGLGETLLTAGKTAEAIPFLEAVANAYPTLRRLQFLLAKAYKATDRPADAKRAQERYLELTRKEEEDLAAPENPK